MKRLIQFISITLGAASGGSLFALAGEGRISWWLVLLIFAWVISFAVQAAVTV